MKVINFQNKAFNKAENQLEEFINQIGEDRIVKIMMTSNMKTVAHMDAVLNSYTVIYRE